MIISNTVSILVSPSWITLVQSINDDRSWITFRDIESYPHIFIDRQLFRFVTIVIGGLYAFTTGSLDWNVCKCFTINVVAISHASRGDWAI